MSSSVLNTASLSANQRLFGSAANEEFWKLYVDSSVEEQKVLRGKDAFQRHVWSGIPDTYRQKVWSQPIDAPPTSFQSEEAEESYKNELQAEIHFTLGRAGREESERDTLAMLIRTVQLMDGGMSKRESIRPGSVELAVTVADVNTTISATMQCFQWIGYLMDRLWSSPEETVCAWVRLLSVMLRDRNAAVADLLDSEPMDAGMVLQTWFTSLLVSTFGGEFSKRCVDIVLLDPLHSDALVYIAIGLMVRVSLSVVDEDNTINNKRVMEQLFSLHIQHEQGHSSFDPYEDAFSFFRVHHSILYSGLFIQNSKNPYVAKTSMNVHNSAYHCLVTVLTLLSETSSTQTLLHEDKFLVTESSLNALRGKLDHALEQEPQNTTLQAQKMELHVLMQTSFKNYESIDNKRQPFTPIITEGAPISMNTPQKAVTANGIIKHTDLAYYLQQPYAHLEGYLRKLRDPRLSVATDNLVARYFMLNGPFLSVFIAHTAQAPIKNLAVDQRGRTIAIVDHSAENLWGIEIYTHNGSPMYILYADSEPERRKWAATMVHVAQLPRLVQ